MKTRKSYALLAGVMCTALVTGFGGGSVAAAEEVTAETLMNGYIEAMGELESSSYQIVMDMDMSMSIFGFAQVMDMDIVMNIDTFGDNAYVSGSMTNRTLEGGEEIIDAEEVEQYAMLEGDEYVIYTYDKEDGSWSKWISGVPAYMTDMLPKFDIANFTIEEQDDQYVVSGDVDLMETIQALPDMFTEFTESLGELGEFSGDATVTYTFDKETQNFTGLKIDMTKAMQDIMMKYLDEAVAAFGEAFADSEEEVDISSLFSVDFNSFFVEVKDVVINQGSEIVLPDEAKDAQLIDADYDDPFGADNDDEESEGPSGTATLPSGVKG